jgi:multimeric flavodoxin WrbA
MDDPARYIAKLAVDSDLLVLITPVLFGCYSPEVKKALERLIPNISPFFVKINGEVHHKSRYSGYAGLVCIGILPGPDPESERIFKTLAGRNAINFHAPSHSAAIIYDGQSDGERRQMIRSALTGVGVA